MLAYPGFLAKYNFPDFDQLKFVLYKELHLPKPIENMSWVNFVLLATQWDKYISEKKMNVNTLKQNNK